MAIRSANYMHFMNEMHIISSDTQYLLNQYPLQETIRI